MGPQYTSCVAPKDFQAKWTIEVAAGILAAAGLISFLNAAVLPALLLVGSAFILQALRIVLEWMLNGKLICLYRNRPECDCGDSGSQVCALGEVGDIEDVGEDKNPIEDVDNDYAINLILSPHDHFAFSKNSENSFDFINNYTRKTITQPAKNNLALSQSGPQGDLVSPQPGIPEHDPPPPGMPKYAGYFRTFISHLSANERFAWNEVFGHNSGGADPSGIRSSWANYLVKNAWKQPVIYSVPVLHCEFEGTRIRDMLTAIEAFSLGGSWCKKNFFFRILCTILQSIFAPFALLAALAAWKAATDGSQASALDDPAAGEVKPRDFIIVKGRWAYDGGHDGYNEIHAVRIVQKVAWVPQTEAEFKDFQKRWCAKLSEVPHVEIPGVRPLPIDLTPRQQEVYDNQQKPENGWELHPEIDGCEPPKEPHKPTPPIIK